MPFPVESESTQLYEEARSAIGSLIANILAIVRQIIDFAVKMFRQLVDYTAQHPEAMVLTVGNFCIWMA